jgi:hypothetical protein
LFITGDANLNLTPPRSAAERGFFFGRAEDIRTLSGCVDFQGGDEESELYVSMQLSEFEVDEIMDLTDVQPYFIFEGAWRFILQGE